MGGDEECGRDFDPVTGERIEDQVDSPYDDAVAEEMMIAAQRGPRPAYKCDAQVRRIDDFGG